MVIHNLLQDILQRLVRGFSQDVGLRIVRRALLVNDRVLVRETVDYVVEEVASLFNDQLDGTTEVAPDVFVEEFCSGGCRIVP